MMAFTDIFIRRPILAAVVSLLILLVGGAALLSLPGARNIRTWKAPPSPSMTGYPGATQDVMQGFVTTPIAQAIATANGIDYLTSTSTLGQEPGQGQAGAERRRRPRHDRDTGKGAAGEISPARRRATIPVITKITDGASAVQYLAFISDTLPVPQITDFADAHCATAD